MLEVIAVNIFFFLFFSVGIFFLQNAVMSCMLMMMFRMEILDFPHGAKNAETLKRLNKIHGEYTKRIILPFFYRGWWRKKIEVKMNRSSY